VGDYASAQKYLEQAVAAARANNDVAEEVRSRGNLASINFVRGYMAEAARQYAALLPIVDRDTYVYAGLLGNYGAALVVLGDFDHALRLQLEALALYTKMGEEYERASALVTLGGLYLRMGDANRALDTSRAGIDAQKRVSNIDGLSSALRIAASAASTLDDHGSALEYLREAARIDRNPHKVALTGVLIATQLRFLGKHDEAERALAGPLQSPNALARANALEEHAQLRLVRHDLDGAIEDLRSADRQYTELGLDYNRIETNTTLSRALLSKGDVAAASKAVDEAIKIVGEIRVKSGNPEWRARFLSARYAPFEARIDVDLAGDADATDATWRAFRTAEGVRARSLADELAPGARAVERGEKEDAALRARLTSLQLDLESRMQRQDSDETATLALRRSIEEARAQLEANSVSNGGIAARETVLPVSLQAVQRRLPAETAVLTYFVGDQRAHGWLLTRTGLRHVAFDAAGPLERKIDAAVSAERGTRDPVAERELATVLLAKLLDGVTEHRLLVIADAPLNGVPFAALPMIGGTDMLLDRFVVSYAPSLSLVLDNPYATRAPSSRVAVISDPVYAPDDRRLRLAGAAPKGVYRGPAPPSPGLTRLAYSAMEANAVASAMGAEDTVQLSGFNASTERVLDLSSKQWRVLHFATHAVARRDEPEQSALFLSQFAADGSLLPANRIAVTDIQRSGLHADLVVLSGCATGDGGELRGEGVLGLTYGFLANGSRAVVAALWPIEDASTARFMSAFYQEYRKSGRAAEALRNAQLQTRGTVPTAVWSSFVVRANEYP
jgi:CHAT domain-containing protein